MFFRKFKQMHYSAQAAFVGGGAAAAICLTQNLQSSIDQEKKQKWSLLNCEKSNQNLVTGLMPIWQSQERLAFLGSRLQSECEEKAWPIYRRIDVQQQARQNKKVWVTHGDGVYDLTTFAKNHPGGSDKLVMAAGGPIEPFWQMYPFHKQDTILQLLAKYKIGQLHPDDVLDEKDLPDFSELQTQNLERSAELLKLQDFPYCAETNSKYMRFGQFYTPNKQAYERNHNLIPQVQIEDYELMLLPGGRQSEISEDDETETHMNLKFTFDDLKKMPQHTVSYCMSCAGNKRKYLKKEFKEVKGLNWSMGAISNATYTGVPIRHILLEVMGLKEEDLMGKHLVAVSLDADFQGKAFEVSIPMERALDPVNEITLAYAMNGEDIPQEHGYPVRLICPGCIAVRCPKWISKLIVSDEEADSAPQRRDYKIVTDKDMSTVDWTKHEPVFCNVLNSAIVHPKEGELLESGEDATIEGWAHPDGQRGAQVIGMQLSFDEGRTWRDVDELMMETKDTKEGQRKVFSWTLWRYRLDEGELSELRKENINGEVTVLARAIDEDGVVQENNIKDLYNIRGILNNAPHSVTFKI